MHHQFERTEFDSMVKSLVKELKALDPSKSVLSRFLIADYLRQIYLIDRSYRSLSKECNQFVLELLDSHPEIFSHCEVYIRIYCKNFDPEGSLKLSESEMKSFLLATAQQYGISLYDIGVLIPRLLLASEQKWVKKFIEDYFPRSIELLPKEVAMTYSIMLLLVSICGDEYEQAEQYLHNAFALARSIRSFSSTELLLRGVEVFLVGMRGDVEYAEVVADRNIRYARTYGHHTGSRSSMVFLQLSRSLLKVAPYDTAKAEKIKAEFQEKSMGPVFRMMFGQLYQKYFASSLKKIAE
jgi:hypothetical protein